jgi:hypothetical protein
LATYGLATLGLFDPQKDSLRLKHSITLSLVISRIIKQKPDLEL